jgi:hypothetical protein
MMRFRACVLSAGDAAHTANGEATGPERAVTTLRPTPAGTRTEWTAGHQTLTGELSSQDFIRAIRRSLGAVELVRMEIGPAAIVRGVGHQTAYAGPRDCLLYRLAGDG